ncbi:MAG TPA: hypothetical protein VMW63_07660 [Methanoregulaceae archaeon]|nr:hypothetical protein [Methanoregulaceae archaeon]
MRGSFFPAIACTIVDAGESVEAASLGGPGAAWTGIGALVPTPGIENWYATDLFGEPSMLPTPLINDYGITTSTVPDCTACSGAVCEGKSTLVMISRMEAPVFNKTLAPGQEFIYPDKSDNSSM